MGKSLREVVVDLRHVKKEKDERKGAQEALQHSRPNSTKHGSIAMLYPSVVILRQSMLRAMLGSVLRLLTNIVTLLTNQLFNSHFV